MLIVFRWAISAPWGSSYLSNLKTFGTIKKTFWLQLLKYGINFQSFSIRVQQNPIYYWSNAMMAISIIPLPDVYTSVLLGAAVAEWLSSWLAEQEDRGSIPRLATWIFRDWLSPASKSRYGWKIAKSTLILKTTNQQPTSVLFFVISIAFSQVKVSIRSRKLGLRRCSLCQTLILLTAIHGRI